MQQHTGQQVLFIQGGGKQAHDTWDDKLVNSLGHELGSKYTVRYPYMPDEADPHYETWKPKLLSEIGECEDGVILIGHSIGGTLLINLLAKEQPKRRLGAIMLIAAPFIGDGGWPDREINVPSGLGKHLPDAPIFLYHGTGDKIVPLTHLRLYAQAIPQATVRELPNRNHQLNNDLSDVARDIARLLESER